MPPARITRDPYGKNNAETFVIPKSPFWPMNFHVGIPPIVFGMTPP